MKNSLVTFAFIVLPMCSLARTRSIPEITHEYINYLESIGNDSLLKMDDLSLFLNKLPDLHLDKDYVLSDFRARGDYDCLVLYARKKSVPQPSNDYFIQEKKKFPQMMDFKGGPEYPGYQPTPYINPFEKIELDGSTNALWQAVLLYLSRFMFCIEENCLKYKKYPMICAEDVDSILAMPWIKGVKVRVYTIEGPDSSVVGISDDERDYLTRELRSVRDLSPHVVRDGESTYFEFYTWSMEIGLEKRMVIVRYDKKKKKVTNLQGYSKIVMHRGFFNTFYKNRFYDDTY